MEIQASITNALELQKRKHQFMKSHSTENYSITVPLEAIDLALLYSKANVCTHRWKITRFNGIQFCPRCKKNLHMRPIKHACHVCLPCLKCSEIVTTSTNKVLLRCYYHHCTYDERFTKYDYINEVMLNSMKYDLCTLKFYAYHSGSIAMIELKKHAVWRCWYLGICIMTYSIVYASYISWIPEEVLKDCFCFLKSC